MYSVLVLLQAAAPSTPMQPDMIVLLGTALTALLVIARILGTLAERLIPSVRRKDQAATESYSAARGAADAATGAATSAQAAAQHSLSALTEIQKALSGLPVIYGQVDQLCRAITQPGIDGMTPQRRSTMELIEEIRKIKDVLASQEKLIAGMAERWSFCRDNCRHRVTREPSGIFDAVTGERR